MLDLYDHSNYYVVNAPTGDLKPDCYSVDATVIFHSHVKSRVRRDQVMRVLLRVSFYSTRTSPNDFIFDRPRWVEYKKKDISTLCLKLRISWFLLIAHRNKILMICWCRFKVNTRTHSNVQREEELVATPPTQAGQTDYRHRSDRFTG